MNVHIITLHGYVLPESRRLCKSCPDDVVVTENCHRLKLCLTTASVGHISITGTKGVGKSTALMWLFNQNITSEKMVYCDLLSDRATEFEVDENTTVLLDNAQRSTLDDRESIRYAKQIIAAYSPQSDFTRHKEVVPNSFEITFVPFTYDDAVQFVKNKIPTMESDVVDYILKVSCRIPLYLNKSITIYHLQTSVAAPNSPDLELYKQKLKIAINNSVDIIYHKIKWNEKDIPTLIMEAAKQGGDLVGLKFCGIVYDEDGAFKLSHYRYLQKALSDKGFGDFSGHWHDLEKLVVILLMASDTPVSTRPKNTSHKKTTVIQKVDDRYSASSKDEVMTALSKSPSIYLVECVYDQPVFDIIVVNMITKRVFLVHVSQQKYADHTKPTDGYDREVVEKLNEYHDTTFTSFFVYATVRMQNYTIDKGVDIYFYDVSSMQCGIPVI